MTRAVHLAHAAVWILCVVSGCRVGEGWGRVDGCIHLPGCSLDPDGDETTGYTVCDEQDRDLQFHPDFFAAEVIEDGSITIRIQDGGYRVGESDGLYITVPDRRWAADQAVGDVEEVPGEARLPVVSLSQIESVEPEKRFKVSAYLNGSCPDTTVSFSQGVGEIWFYSMYQSRDLGDGTDEDRIHLGFELDFVDPWPYEEPQPDSPRMHVVGEVSFDYQRGSPAQVFP